MIYQHAVLVATAELPRPTPGTVLPDSDSLALITPQRVSADSAGVTLVPHGLSLRQGALVRVGDLIRNLEALLLVYVSRAHSRYDSGRRELAHFTVDAT